MKDGLLKKGFWLIRYESEVIVALFSDGKWYNPATNLELHNEPQEVINFVHECQTEVDYWRTDQRDMTGRELIVDYGGDYLEVESYNKSTGSFRNRKGNTCRGICQRWRYL